MEELSKAGFKGQLKTLDEANLEGIAHTDQLVIHGQSKKDQEIAYNVLRNLYSSKLKYLSGGIDTKDGSFSETLAKGQIEKYITLHNEESKSANQAAESERDLANARKEANSQPNESDNLFEESSGQMDFFDGLKESQEEIREEIQKTDEQIKGQMSLFDIVKNQDNYDENNLVDVDIESYDTLYSKLAKIKELSEDISLFDLEDIDDSVIRELDETLFSLSEKDLKDLGFEDTSAIIEDLKEIQERLHNVNWEFENNTYDDESFIDSGILEDSFDYVEDLELGINKTKQSADAAGISISNLMNLISEMDISKFYSNKDSNREKIIKEQNQQLEKQIELSKAKQSEANKVIEAEKSISQAEKDITTSTVEKSKKVSIYIPDKNQISEQKNYAIDATEKIKDASKKSADSQISDYQRIKKEIKETREEADKYLQLDQSNEDKRLVPKYVFDEYNKKLNKYSQLSDEEFDEKVLKKQERGFGTKKHDKFVSIASRLALIEEGKNRKKNLSINDFIDDNIDDLDSLMLLIEKSQNYISSLTDENYDPDLYKNKHIEANKKYWNLQKQLDEAYKSASIEDKIDYEVNKLIESTKGEGQRGAFGNSNASNLIKIFTDKGITDKNIISEQVKSLTDSEDIIKAVNKELSNMEAREKAVAIAEEEATKAAYEETQRLEQKNQQIKANVDNQEALSATTPSQSSNIPISNKYTSINKGFNNRSVFI